MGLRQCSHIELTALSYGLLALQFPCLPQSEKRQLPESLLHSPSHTLALSSNPSDFAECLIFSCLHLAAAPCPSQSLNILFILQGKAFPRSEPAEPIRKGDLPITATPHHFASFLVLLQKVSSHLGSCSAHCPGWHLCFSSLPYTCPFLCE